jgi:hypothetical protein
LPWVMRLDPLGLASEKDVVGVTADPSLLISLARVIPGADRTPSGW